MKRKIINHLEAWRINPSHKPLILRGARQVGKTFVVEQFGQMAFENMVSVNFELDLGARGVFSSLDPTAIINALSLMYKQEIVPGRTLLFLDEIQVCPQAITALRYFKEKLPALHVIAAGSLLEFALQKENISMPVGRVEYVYMHPCTFEEMLLASENTQALQLLQEASLASVPDPALHMHLLKLFREYMMVGGMPEAVQHYVDHQDAYQVQRVQNSILNTYRDDFGKYATAAQYKYVETVYDKAPGMVGTQVSYSKIDSSIRSRDLKQAINLLEYAGLLKRIYSTAASGLPLNATLNEKKFKFSFLDVGLVQRKSGLDAQVLLSEDIVKLNDGMLAEQVVGQLLLASQDAFALPELYFWARDKKSAQAEVDYILNIAGRIVPVEVKSGAVGRLKSLKLLLESRGLPLGVKISSAPLGVEGNILNIPIYMTEQLAHLVQDSGLRG